jgi:hypothetical protein
MQVRQGQYVGAQQGRAHPVANDDFPQRLARCEIFQHHHRRMRFELGGQLLWGQASVNGGEEFKGDAFGVQTRKFSPRSARTVPLHLDDNRSGVGQMTAQYRPRFDAGNTDNRRFEYSLQPGAGYHGRN